MQKRFWNCINKKVRLCYIEYKFTYVKGHIWYGQR